MALSEQEQRLLEQMEQALAAEDPKLAQSLRGTTVRAVHGRRAMGAGLGLLAGLVALVGGLEISPLISILGFVIMLVSVVAGLSAFEASTDGRPGGHGPQSDAHPFDPHGDRLRGRAEDN